jgi:hypothetical protein
MPAAEAIRGIVVADQPCCSNASFALWTIVSRVWSAAAARCGAL